VTNDEETMSAVSDRGHKFSIAVGPAKRSGDDSMTPSELFISSLGMCIAVLLRSYCSRAELDCGVIKVTTTAQWNSEAKCLTKVKARVEVPGDWDDRRKRAFYKVAEACPVHETIEHWDGLQIEIR